MIDSVEALQRIDPEGLEQILYPRIDSHARQKPVAVGVAASPGAASGIAVFDVAKAEAMGKRGEKVVLIREETKPDDVPAFTEAILAALGRLKA